MNWSPPSLSADAAAAVATLARLGASERRLAMAALGWREPTRVWTPRALGTFPTLTELVPALDLDAVYDSDAWTRGYVRGPTLVAYALQARGLGCLAADLGGLSLAKAGTTAKHRIARRVSDLGRTEYGAWVRNGHGYERDDGFDVFEPAPRLQIPAQHPRSPVRLCDFGIEVDLPAGSSLSAGLFEAALNARLAPLRLGTVADTDAGRALCEKTGVPPHRLRRFYRRGCVHAAATEITLLRPQADGAALARLCASIVVEAVQGLLPLRPVR